jgi:hypothetical protein
MLSTDKDEMRDWIAELLSNVEEGGTCSAIALVHYASGGDRETEIQTWKSGGPRWSAQEIANAADTLATRFAKGLVGGGAQQFQLHGLVGQSTTPSKFFPFIRHGQLNINGAGMSAAGALSTEPPTPTGITQQSQRWGEIILQGTMAERLAIMGAMGKLIADLHATNRQVMSDFGHLFLEYKRLLSETAAQQGEQAVRIITARRNAQMFHELTRLLPALIPGMPQASGDLAMLRGVSQAFTKEQLEYMSGLVAQGEPQAQVAFATFISRLEEIQRVELEDAKKLRELAREPVGVDPLADAGGEAFTVIDPKERLLNVVGKEPQLEAKASNGVAGNGNGNGVAHGPSEDEALWNDLFASVPPGKISMMIGVLAAENPELAKRLKARFDKTNS